MSTTDSAASPRTPRWQRKATVILGAVLLAALAFGTTTRTWLNVALPATTVATPDVTVSGSDAATAVTAFAVVGVAAALAAAIAGRVGRWVTAVILVVSGVGVAAASYRIISDPLQGAAGAIGKAIGVTSAQGTVVELTAMPYVAMVIGILIGLSGVWLALAGRHWTTSRRYAPTTAPAEAGAPAAGTSASAAGTAADGSTAGIREDDEPLDEIDGWDRLTRGEDPTDK